MSMTKREAVALFRNAAHMAAALGITRSAVSQWADDEPIPEAQELKIRYELRPSKRPAKRKAA